MMESNINVKHLLQQTITGMCIALQQEVDHGGFGEDVMILYKSLLDNIVSYTALCGHCPDGVTDWINRTMDFDADFMRVVLNDYEVCNGLQEFSVDTRMLIELLPEKVSKAGSLLQAATGDNGNFMNAPTDGKTSGWSAPKAMIQSVIPMTQADSTGGLDHCVEILIKVYTKFAHVFYGRDYKESSDLARNILINKDPNIIQCMWTEDNVSPTVADAVTVCEALHWTAGYISTGACANFVLAYAGFEPDDKFLMDRPVIWNCMKTTSHSVETYVNYGLVDTGNMRDIPILAMSLDVLKVTMQEVN